MQRIIVKNFGPLKNIDLEIKDYMIFLGPQASGKSTLAKLIYGFKEVMWQISFLNEKLWTYKINKIKFSLNFILDEWLFRIKDYFSTLLQNHQGYYIEYKYGDSISIILSENTGIIKVEFSQSFYDILSKIEKEIQLEINQISSRDYTFFDNERIEYAEYLISEKVENKVQSAFTVPKGVLFIPDERSINTNNQSSIFLNNVQKYRKYFGEGFDNVEKSIKNTVRLFDENKFTLIKKYFLKVLKGDYENIDGGRISLSDGTKISLEIASSGQKEVIGILIILTIEILKKSRDFYVIEEPEAHLFPEAQKDITYLISLLANQEGNQVIITSHSHYILGALNILINAHRIGQTNPEEVEKIVPKELWVDKNRIFTGFLENGIIKDIYDDEAEMIKIQQLNAVAGEINKDFDRLLDLEFANENV